MNLSSTLRPLRWAIAIALVSATGVVHAQSTETCQDEYTRDTRQVDAEFKEDIAKCHYRGNSDCWATAKKKKAKSIKEASQSRRECFKALTPKLDPNDPKLKWKETFGLDPEKTVTLPDGTEEKIKNLALIEKNGRILGFSPTWRDSSGHEWHLDRRTVKWDYIRGNDRMILPTGKYRDSQSGMEEWKPGLWLNRNPE